MAFMSSRRRSAALVAVTVTVCALEIEAGAVYRPVFETVPTAGFKDQVTAVFDDPLTVAVNCWVWDAVRDTVNGVRETVTGGVRAMVALADLVESAALVAVTVTVCAPEIEAGAV